MRVAKAAAADNALRRRPPGRGARNTRAGLRARRDRACVVESIARRRSVPQAPNPTAVPTLPHKLSVLVFITNRAGELLLIERAKAPNLGQWSPIGGKLETATGESPHECAARETREETGLACAQEDFHLFAMIAERAYEGGAHWLMFLFVCRRPIERLPPDMHEGRFGFFSRAAVDGLALPETDRTALWPLYDTHREGFVALRADCTPGRPVEAIIEEVLPAGRGVVS